MAHRPNLLKLVTKISLESMTYTGITYSDPEYRILDPIFSDDMVAVMMHLKLNTNRTLEEISRRADMDIDFVRDQLAKLRETGAVRVHYVDGVANYYYPIWVPGIMEGVLSNKAQCERYPDLGACFEEYTRRRIAPLVPNLGTGMSLMRVMLCVTITMVYFDFNSEIRSSILLVLIGSRAEVGSSMSSTSGSTASALAMQSRCCCPPESPNALLYRRSFTSSQSAAPVSDW